MIFNADYLPAFIHTPELFITHLGFLDASSIFVETYHNDFWEFMDKERAKMLGMLNEVTHY